MQGLSTVARELREARIERDIERRDELSRENRGFVQVYPKGWSRLQYLIRTNPSAARLYASLRRTWTRKAGSWSQRRQCLPRYSM